MAQQKKSRPQPVDGGIDRVNHPSHYQAEDRNGTPIEAVDVIEAFAPDDPHLAHALTYMLRAGTKVEPEDEDEIEAYIRDLKKARWWITRAIEFYDPDERPEGE